MQLQTQEKANLKQPSNTLHADPTDHSCQAHQQSQSNCSMQPQTRRPKTASKARLELRGSENSRPNPGDHPPGSNSIMVRPIMEGIPRVQPTTPAPSHLRSTGPAVRKPRARSKTVRSHPPGQRQRELKTRAAQPTLDAAETKLHAAEIQRPPPLGIRNHSQDRMLRVEGSSLLHPPIWAQLQTHKISQHIPELCLSHTGCNDAGHMTRKGTVAPAQCKQALTGPIHGQQSRQTDHHPQLGMHPRTTTLLHGTQA